MGCILVEMKWLLPLLLAGVGAAGEMKVETKTLSNGLGLVAIHNPGSRSESILTFLPMGLTSDGPGQTQWSHLVEHLVVRSTAGGDVEHFNAETVDDHMRLDSYGAAENWQDGLDHHRRWLQGVALTQQNLKAEKPNVIGEADTVARNSFTHKFALAAWAQASRHGRSEVAVKGDVLGARLEAIERYRNEHLIVLDRTVVCMVGGVEPAVALAAATKRLEGIRSQAKSVAPVETHAGSRSRRASPAVHLAHSGCGPAGLCGLDGQRPTAIDAFLRRFPTEERDGIDTRRRRSEDSGGDVLLCIRIPQARSVSG